MSNPRFRPIRIAGALAVTAAACGPADVQPKMPSQGYVTEVFQECLEQEKLGDASACWKLFLQRYEKVAGPAEIEVARLKSENKAAIVPECSSGTAWDGQTCVSLCRKESLEAWDNSEQACIRKLEMECADFFHQEDGHCVADPTCPAGYRRKPAGGCDVIPPEPPFRQGERVISLVDQAKDDGKIAVKRGAKGTFWYTFSDLAFVVWDDFVGAEPRIPGKETGVPQDKKAYSYWVGLDEIAKDSTSIADQSLIPQWCGQRDDRISYGRVKVGAMVKLSKHRAVGGEANWSQEMDEYVGKITRVMTQPGTDAAGCPVVTVSIDKEKHYWRIRDLSLAPVTRAQTTTSHSGNAGAGTEPPK
ncbi:MAG: hypothetical protein R3B70_07945 [Polyangiaceae bacterium]